MGMVQVLVTGGSGLVGRAIASELDRDERLKRMYSFTFLSSKDADLTDLEQTRKVFALNRPEFVVNLAAQVGGLYANMNDNKSFYQVNKDINENVLKCSSELKVKKCISCLSTCIFPAEVEYPIDESKIHLGPPHKSNEGYSLAKREVDLLNRQYNRLCGGESLFTAIIPTNIYGKHDNFDPERSHVIPGLIYKAYMLATKAVTSNSDADATLKICGSGRPLRQFIYAPDLARLILWALENYVDPEPLILSPDEDEEVSIGQVAEIVRAIFSEKFGIQLSMSYDLTCADGQYRKPATNRKLQTLIPSFSFTPLETGLLEVINWFCDTYPNVRK